ncbi:hypothetical protein PIB30_030255 [Stylosanthes scabra]|uniref:Uncharacterized protein n=1 Tax=Stylosanthes scabra TaxID=79078 RepID=A0ABU6XD10_9FABA|nr:hypothetical protein [Stylosanthes scabra]
MEQSWPKRKEMSMKEIIDISSSNHDSLKTNNKRHDEVNSPHNNYPIKESYTAFTSVVEKITSVISFLAKIVESQSSPSARLFTQESINSGLNSLSTPGNSPNILTSDMDVHIKKFYQDKEDRIEDQSNEHSTKKNENTKAEAIMQKLLRPDEHVLNKLCTSGQARHVPINAKTTNGKYIGKKASTSFVLPRRSFSQKILDWMPLAFKVPDDMFLTAEEVLLPHIYTSSARIDKLLVSIGANFASRNSLSTLVPGEQVVQDVLDTVTCHLTKEHRKIFKMPSM